MSKTTDFDNILQEIMTKHDVFWRTVKVFASFREESVIFGVKKLLKVHVCMVFIHFMSFACRFYTCCQFYLSFLQVL